MVSVWSWEDAFPLTLMGLMGLLVGYALSQLQVSDAAIYLFFVEVGVVWLALTHAHCRRSLRAR